MNAKLKNELLEDVELTKLTMTDQEVCDMLGIKLKTLQNRICKEDFKGMYSISPINGKRFWYKPKVLGLS